MLSAAEDILNKQQGKSPNLTAAAESCEVSILSGVYNAAACGLRQEIWLQRVVTMLQRLQFLLAACDRFKPIARRTPHAASYPCNFFRIHPV